MYSVCICVVVVVVVVSVCLSVCLSVFVHNSRQYPESVHCSMHMYICLVLRILITVILFTQTGVMVSQAFLALSGAA